MTNVGRIEREDGSTFERSDLHPIRVGLSTYLSFCVGRWTDLARLRGFASDDTAIWEEWFAPSVEPHIGRRCWLDRNMSAQFVEPFPNFMRLWTDEYWGRILNDVIHWYVSANAQSGAIEGAIVLLQNALELLAAAILVEHYKWIDAEAFRKLNAANKFRLLFRWAGIPTDIPAGLSSLSQHAKQENLDDSPEAIVWVRNRIVHPTEKNRDAHRSAGNKVSTEAWMLGLWYLEICLLKLIGYQTGTYGSRLRSRYSGDVDPLPNNFRNCSEFPLS